MEYPLCTSPGHRVTNKIHMAHALLEMTLYLGRKIKQLNVVNRTGKKRG